MDQQTLELLRTLQSSERDAPTFELIRGMLTRQRSQLVAEDDRATLADISELLEMWADSAAPPLAAAAVTHAAQIAEQDLEQAERAVQLYVLGLERSPLALETLESLDALLSRRGERERLETILAMHAKTLCALPNIDPEQPARVLRRLGQLRAERGPELGPAIEAYEQALDLAADSDTIRALADLYAKRGAVGDAQQGADLYCTLGDVLGVPDGAAMLERALDLAPDHDGALDLLESYVPVAEQAAKLKQRWAGYIERSDNDSGVDRRRLLLSRAHAADGKYRDALICLGPLIDKGDPEAGRLQAAFLANLQEEERQSEPAASDAAKGGNGAPTVRRPATLVGFRLPPGQGVPEVAEPPPADLAAPAETEDETEDEAEDEPDSPPMQFGTTARNAGAAIRGGTLVGFRVPPATPSAAVETQAAADVEAGSAATDAAAVPPTADAIKAAVASAKAASAPLITRSASAAAQERAAQRAKRSPTADAPAPTPTPTAAGGVRAPKRSSAAASMPPRRSASPSAAPERSSSAPSAVQGAAAKAAALRAARTSAPPARSSSPAPLRAPSSPPPLKRASSPTQRPAARQSPAPVAAPQFGAASGPAAFAATMPLIHSAPTGTLPPSGMMSAPEPVYAPAAEVSAAAPPAAVAHPATFPPIGVQAMPALDADSGAFAAPKRKLDPRWLAAGGVAATALLIGVVWAGLGDSSKPSGESAVTRASSQPAVGTAVPASTGPAAAVPTTAAPTPAPPAGAIAPAAQPGAASTASTLASAVAPAAATPSRVPSHRAPALEVKAVSSQLKVRGGQLSAKAVTSALEDSLPKIERCYAEAVERTPRLEGRITFGFSVDKSGHTGKVRKLNSTIKDAGLLRCSSEAIQKTRFPKPKKRAAQVTLPLTYEKR